MSMKTIAVLKESELKDGEMFVNVEFVFLFCLHICAGKKSPSKAKGRFCYLVSEIKSTLQVPFVHTMAHLLLREC